MGGLCGSPVPWFRDRYSGHPLPDGRPGKNNGEPVGVQSLRPFREGSPPSADSLVWVWYADGGVF